MSGFEADFEKKCPQYDPSDPNNGQKDIYVQLVLSLTLGVSAFFGFCILRPRWKSLYAARKRQVDAADALPELPDSFFGWMPVLYRVTEEQVLASAGLDAYVFLAFFKMSMKLFGVMFLFTCAILAPINKYFVYLPTFGNGGDPRVLAPPFLQEILFENDWKAGLDVMEKHKGDKTKIPDTSYLWAYFVFTYVFTGLVIYFMSKETRRVIQVRQDYLGSQSTITDRTIRLSGIPKELRSAENIKEFLEKLEIGKVESVTMCLNWKILDDLMIKRAYTLRKLEEAWTVHLGRGRSKRVFTRADSNNTPQDGDEEANDHEDGNLLGASHVTTFEKPRPTTRLWYGFLNLQSKKVDAIDYYEEKLRKLDDQIKEARKKEYKTTPLAFVTMDSIPACQMAVQALLDPSPMQLLAKLAPAPTDVVWANTYMSRSSRMIRKWSVTILIVVLTIIWFIPVVPLAGLLNLCSIKQVSPKLADFLYSHDILKALVQTGLPTLIVSLLNIAVPFLYDYLANLQGMISQGDVELSVISKNFFFTFFNVFLVFTAFGTASQVWPLLQDSLKDSTKLTFHLAQSVQTFAVFYVNFILLQSVGLLPFRLLEFGSVALYPIMLVGSKTPRDYAELVRPPIFKYGFYLPSAILIFILCLVYSILPAGYLVLLFGLIYFVLGYYTYKYQLLYAMDHPQHATGGAWTMICYRIILGLGTFQLVMIGVIAGQNAFIPGALTLPLIPFTIWYSYYFSRTYEPLMKYIALRSINREGDADSNSAQDDSSAQRPIRPRSKSFTIDEDREKGLVFVNPSLVLPLEKLWINKAPDADEELPASNFDREESATSSILVSREIADSGSTSKAPHQSTGSIGDASGFGSNAQHNATLRDSIFLTQDASVIGVDPRKATVGTTPPNCGINGGSVKSNRNVLPCGSESQSSDGQGEQPHRQNVSNNFLAFDSIISKTDERGRSLNRALSCQDPFALRETKAREGSRNTAIDLNPYSIAKSISRSHTFFEDPSDPSAYLDDSLLEPCPHIPLGNTVSEILDHVYKSGVGSVQDGRSPTRVRTATQDNSLLCPADKQSSSHHTTPVSRPSSASLLPTEIIQQILYSLAPVDFNSARHVCRSWLISSLDEPLLKEMLERGGFSTMIRQNAGAGRSAPCINAIISSEWQMSKSLARECALGPDWSGNGLYVPAEGNVAETSTQSAFVNAASIDFSEGATLDHSDNIAGSAFTFSTCGRILMVANGCLVYIYQLNQTNSSTKSGSGYQGSYLSPLTCIICPSRVLACSVDTSSSRNAIAILLDGRMGLVCDLTCLKPSVATDEPSTSAHLKIQNTQGTQGMGSTLPGDSFSPILPGLLEEPKWPSDVPLLASLISTEPIELPPSGSNDDGPGLTSTKDFGKVNLEEFGAARTQKTPATNNFSTENGFRSLYRNLCSDDDPPRSVAICPQRRCVAFGCSSGIELHWVDALTGQDLNRWFPLTVPSDFLFFLPPRKSVDSAKKLRLISSAARPSEKPSIALRRLGARSQSSPFWERCGWPHILGYPYDNRESTGARTFSDRAANVTITVGASEHNRSLDFDHFCAVPLSDGYHVLFTDPPTGRLCLGSDAPVGGPTKLLRKIWFEGPEGQGNPSVYVGGSDLSCGVRVVAAYGDSIWLFSVPPDIFSANHCSNFGLNSSIWAKSKPHRTNQNTKWTDWWPHDGLQEWLRYGANGMAGWRPQGVWPVKIRGQQVGSCSGVVDLAIASRPSMTIWATSSEGFAKVWKLDIGECQSVAKVLVMQDGTIRQVDIEGDTEMTDGGSVPEFVPSLLRYQPESFDGTNSVWSLSDHVLDYSDYTTRRRHHTRYDTGGDVVMTESPARSSLHERDSSSETIASGCCIRAPIDDATRLAHRAWEKI